MLRHACIVQSFLPTHLPTTITSHDAAMLLSGTLLEANCKHNMIYEGESRHKQNKFSLPPAFAGAISCHASAPQHQK